MLLGVFFALYAAVDAHCPAIELAGGAGIETFFAVIGEDGFAAVLVSEHKFVLRHDVRALVALGEEDILRCSERFNLLFLVGGGFVPLHAAAVNMHPCVGDEIDAVGILPAVFVEQVADVLSGHMGVKYPGERTREDIRALADHVVKVEIIAVEVRHQLRSGVGEVVAGDALLKAERHGAVVVIKEARLGQRMRRQIRGDGYDEL